MDLFSHAHQQRMRSEAPLAARMRPRTLEEFVGQGDILGPGKLLRGLQATFAIEADRLFSEHSHFDCHHPVGTARDGQDHCSKDRCLAMMIANLTKSYCETLSAVLAGKAELREGIDKALERRKLYQKKTVLFMKDVREASNWA